MAGAAAIAAAELLAAGTGPVRATAGLADTSSISRGTTVAFQDCSELAAITTVPVDVARASVPAAYTLAGDATGTPFVVRVAHCQTVRVDHDPPTAGAVAQLGVSVISPDGTGDINNYTLWYLTSDAALAHALTQDGIPAQWVPHLEYELDHDGRGGTRQTLALQVRPPGVPAFSVHADVQQPTAPAVAFQANWWVGTGQHLTKMSTPIPALRFGSATSRLDTAPTSPLGILLGRSSSRFALLDSFNRFGAAQMRVTRLSPASP